MKRPTQSAASLALSALAVGFTGCNVQEHFGSCPTDARAITLSCAGQEAVRKCPCGPDASYYGHRPTTWNHWPGGWDQFDCEQCSVTTSSTVGVASIQAEPTPALATPIDEMMSITSRNTEVDEETVPIEPIDSVEPAKEVAGPEEVAPIAPLKQSEPRTEQARPFISAPTLPELPKVPSIPEPVSNGPAGLLDLPDPVNSGPSEALSWEQPPSAAEEISPGETTAKAERLPVFTDLFAP